MEVVAVKNNWQKMVIDYSILCGILFLIEIIFKLVSGLNVFAWSTLRILLGILFVSLIISIPTYFVKRKYRMIINSILVFIISIYTIAQAGFSNFLGVYISFGTSDQAGAVTSYIFDFIRSFKWYFYLIMVPFIILVVTYVLLYKRSKAKENIPVKKKRITKKEKLRIAAENKKYKIITIVSSILLFLVTGSLYYGTLVANFMQDKYQTISTKNLFMNVSMPNLAIREFGSMGYGILDIRALIFNNHDEEELSFNNEENVNAEEKYAREIDDTIYQEILAEEKNKNYIKGDNYMKKIVKIYYILSI